MTQAGFDSTLRNAAISGSIACAATLAAVAACGVRRRRGATSPINAISHVFWGDEAAGAVRPDLRHTVPAIVINEGAAIFWAALYERAFGRAAEQGRIVTAFMGGAAVAALAYLVDYRAVPKRLTPGWEYHLRGLSLAAVYAALALSLPARGLIRRMLAQR
jgi:hypothetical protein